jgi:hypothetical protein
VFSESLLATAADQQELDALEISWITKLDTMSPAGYNTKLGKQGHPTDDVRQRISATLKGVPKSAEHRKNISTGQKRRPPRKTGIKRSLEAIEKTRNALKGRPVPPERRRKISATLKGRKGTPKSPAWIAKCVASRAGYTPSAETRAKLSGAHKGRKMSESNRQKLIAINTGRVVSDETRSKISAAQIGKKKSEASLVKKRATFARKKAERMQQGNG